MATVFRVQKTKDFTVMSNHHLKNKDLSLRSKGLLSFMLSLPEDWDYSLKGLATLNKEGIDAIRSAINELEAFGYIERSRVRNEKGQPPHPRKAARPRTVSCPGSVPLP